MNNRILKWSSKEQSWALKNFTNPDFFSRSKLEELVEQFTYFLAPGVCARARQFGFVVEPQEVVNLIFVRLLNRGTDGRAIAEYIACADDPWSYISQSLKQWATPLWGHRGINLEHAENLPARGTDTAPDDSQLTPLDEAVTLATNILAVRVAKHLRRELHPLVQFLAESPPSRRSYESKERAIAAELFPSFNAKQIAAISNIIWGTRPRNAESSIMGQLLLNAEWMPTSSLSHVKAIKRFEKEMHEASVLQQPKLYA